jgi:tetratricopeptide (TPR) repeat protein
MRPILYTFEEHGEVLAFWHEMGYQNETILVFDRHLDLKKIELDQLQRIRQAKSSKELSLLNRDIPFRDDDTFAYGLDNFLYAAAQIGLLKRLVWVIPEPTYYSVEQLGKILWEMLSLIPDHGEEVLQTFRYHHASVSAIVSGLLIEITTLRRLSSLHFLQSCRVDIDLDFFYGEDGKLAHTVSEVCKQLQQCCLTDRLQTMTYSIYSGFLPESYRWLGQEIANLCGYQIQSLTTRRQKYAVESMEIISRQKEIQMEQYQALWEKELSELNGVGWTVRGLLALQMYQLFEAYHCYEQAHLHGDRATWLGYSIGLYLLRQQQYEEAATWFQRAEGSLVDTLQAHSLQLRLLCEYRSGQFEAALATADRCLSQLPLRLDAYKIGIVTARMLSCEDQALEWEDKRQIVQSILLSS